jgi:hypothetical protein
MPAALAARFTIPWTARSVSWPPPFRLACPPASPVSHDQIPGNRPSYSLFTSVYGEIEIKDAFVIGVGPIEFNFSSSWDKPIVDRQATAAID